MLECDSHWRGAPTRGEISQGDLWMGTDRHLLANLTKCRKKQKFMSWSQRSSLPWHSNRNAEVSIDCMLTVVFRSGNTNILRRAQQRANMMLKGNGSERLVDVPSARQLVVAVSSANRRGKESKDKTWVFSVSSPEVKGVTKPMEHLAYDQLTLYESADVARRA